MDNKFILSCGSTVDMPYSYMSERNIPIIFYTYTIDGVEYVDDMGRDANALPKFYGFLNEGKLPSTSQINQYRYEEFFEEQLNKGDLLHIAFGSGMSGSVNNAFAAAEAMKEKYPERKIVVIDSTCSSSGYGMLVDYAADMRDKGASIEETTELVNTIKGKIHHQFFSTDLTHFRRSGRVSGPAAMIGTVLGIYPVMRLDNAGKIIASHCGPGTVAVFFLGDSRIPLDNK